MDDARQYLIDPATGRLVEGRWVCPNCKTVNVGPRCVSMDCGRVLMEESPTREEPDGIDVDDDDTDLFTPDTGGSD